MVDHNGDARDVADPGRAAPRVSVLEPLDEAASLRLISEGGVGRVAFTGRFGPVVLPVNYKLHEGTIVFRTVLGSPMVEDLRTGISGAEQHVAFEVDEIDTTAREGWSVLIHGPVHHVDSAAERASLIEAGVEPWPDGERELFIRIVPQHITGRHIRHADRLAGDLDPRGYAMAPRDDGTIQSLNRDTCLVLLNSVVIGRVAWAGDDGRVVVLPVNFVVDDGTVVFRTALGNKLSALREGSLLSFEADDVEPGLRTGWSVLVTGTAKVVTDTATVEHLERLPLAPWPPTATPYFVQLYADEVTGRRLPLHPGGVTHEHHGPADNSC